VENLESSKQQIESEKDKKFDDLQIEFMDLELSKKQLEAEKNKKIQELQTQLDGAALYKPLDGGGDADKVRDLQKQIEELNVSKRKLEAEKDEKIALLQTQIDKLGAAGGSDTNKQLEANKREVAVKAEAIRSLVKEVQENENKYIATLKDLQAKIVTLESSKVQVEEMNENYEKKLKEAERVLEITRQEITQLQTQKKKLEETRNSAGYDQPPQNSEIDSLKFQLKSASEELRVKELELESIQKVPSASSNHVVDHQEVVQKLKDELEALKGAHFSWMVVALKLDRVNMRKKCNIDSSQLLEKIEKSGIHFTEWHNFLKAELDKSA